MKKFLSLLIVLLGLAVGSIAQTATTFPKVVAVFHRCNQTEPIAVAPIFTPKGGGLFRFTIYIAILKPNHEDESLWAPTLIFTNELGEQTQSINIGTVYSAQSLSTQEVEWDREGAPISVGVSSNGDVSGSEYNITIVVEQLM